MSVINVVAKTIGAATVAGIGYDVLHNTRRNAIYETRNQIGKDISHAYMLDATTGTGSPLMEKAKEAVMNFRMDDNVRDAFVYCKSIVSKFAQNLWANVVGLTLGLGALFSKTSSKVPGLKGFVPKPLGVACAVGAAFVMGTSLITNLFPRSRTSSVPGSE